MFSLTMESKFSIDSGGWSDPPVDGVCSLIVLLPTYLFGGAEQESWRPPSRYSRADHIPCQRSVHNTDGVSSPGCSSNPFSRVRDPHSLRPLQTATSTAYHGVRIAAVGREAERPVSAG
jgi:hypothetical protein